MCGRFDTSHLTWADIHRQLSGFLPVKSPALNLEMNDDVRPTTSQAVARVEEGGWVIEPMRWSFLPHYWSGKPVKDTAKGAGDGFKLTTFNCKTEQFTEADAKPSATWATPFKSRRCIVPASAWYEWTGEKGSKVKHRFARADGSALWFAGLWGPCRTADEGEIKSFAILTGPSAGWLGDYHDRAPVILEPDEWSTWLDPSRDVIPLLKSVRPDRFELRAAA